MVKVVNAKKEEETSTRKQKNYNGRTNTDAGLWEGNKEKNIKHNIS